MESAEMSYAFSAKPYSCASPTEPCGWTFVALPKEMALAIRDSFKWMEEGWGRMKVTAKIGNSEWKTAIWFDTKQETYLLPLKAAIRKKEHVALEEAVKITIVI